MLSPQASRVCIYLQGLGRSRVHHIFIFPKASRTRSLSMSSPSSSSNFDTPSSPPYRSRTLSMTLFTSFQLSLKVQDLTLFPLKVAFIRFRASYSRHRLSTSSFLPKYSRALPRAEATFSFLSSSVDEPELPRNLFTHSTKSEYMLL